MSIGLFICRRIVLTCLVLLLLLSTMCTNFLSANARRLSHSAELTEEQRENELDVQWTQFKAKFNKQYGSNSLEEQHRRNIWEANLRYIQQHNREYELGLHTFTLGMNAFGDLTQREFADKFLMKVSAEDLQRTKESSVWYTSPLNGVGPLPDEVDWRKKGMVTPVKNQGHCGSCWAFSSTGALEGQYFRKTSKLVSFSEQQLVDCNKKSLNCLGGNMVTAFKYVQKFGIESEKSYPYTAKWFRKGKYNSSSVVTKITNHVHIRKGDEKALQEASATVGPISVSIDANHPSFQLYKNGVYNEPSCSSARLDHAVLLVGYGLHGVNKTPFWLVKNSWGTGWGDQGYIRMSRNKNNQCGIATEALYPLL